MHENTRLPLPRSSFLSLLHCKPWSTSILLALVYFAATIGWRCGNALYTEILAPTPWRSRLFFGMLKKHKKSQRSARLLEFIYPVLPLQNGASFDHVLVMMSLLNVYGDVCFGNVKSKRKAILRKWPLIKSITLNEGRVGQDPKCNTGMIYQVLVDPIKWHPHFVIVTSYRSNLLYVFI